MIRYRFNTSGYLLLICILVVLYPHKSFSDQGRFAGELDALLTTLNIPHTHDLDNMINASQVWRRHPKQERWQLKDLDIDKTRHDKALAQLRHLGLVNEIKPNHKYYDYVLLLGAMLPNMQKRLEHLASLWETGIRFNKVILLVGLRPLTPDIDQVEALTTRATGKTPTPETIPLNELEGAEMMYLSTRLPTAMREVPIEYVYTPRRWENYRWQRANTRETATTWVKQQPEPGLTLVMSEQPNAHYQREVIRQELPDTFQVDLAARAARPDTRLVLYLDALALWLHNLQKQHSSIAPPLLTPSQTGVSPTRH